MTLDRAASKASEPTLFQRSAEPLAAHMRPHTLEEFLGQDEPCALDRQPYRPPLKPFSAVTEGVGRVPGIIKEAEKRFTYEGLGTILFLR